MPKGMNKLNSLKEHRCLRLSVIVSDGRVVDIEVRKKIDHDRLRSLAM